MVSLDSVLVDPRLSPRRVPVDRKYLEAVTAAVQEGAELPPLLIGRLKDNTAPWCACQKPDNAQARARWNAETDRIPWASRPVLPESVLLDGLTRFHALRAAGKRQAACVRREQPVGSGAEVRALSLGANDHHGRALTSGDLRSTVVELYLGRPQKAGSESWVPGGGGLSQAAIAEAVGKSTAWVSRVLRWAEFLQAVGLDDEQDPGLLRASALAMVDPRRWRELVWLSQGVPAVYPALDESGRAVSLSEPRPLWELPLEQVERWVQVWTAESVELGPVAAGEVVVGPTVQMVLPDSQNWFDGEITPFPSGTREVARELYGVADRLSPERWDEVVAEFRPLWIDVAQTWEALRKHGKRLGKDV